MLKDIEPDYVDKIRWKPMARIEMKNMPHWGLRDTKNSVVTRSPEINYFDSLWVQTLSQESKICDKFTLDAVNKKSQLSVAIGNRPSCKKNISNIRHA
jgi:hypothetical protein